MYLFSLSVLIIIMPYMEFRLLFLHMESLRSTYSSLFLLYRLGDLTKDFVTSQIILNVAVWAYSSCGRNFAPRSKLYCTHEDHFEFCLELCFYALITVASRQSTLMEDMKLRVLTKDTMYFCVRNIILDLITRPLKFWLHVIYF